MRIVSGTCRGRIINPPSNFRARPTTDFAKENIFNVLSNRYDFEDCDVLDLFSGTGCISYEFASRGARSVLSVELDPYHQRFIKEMAVKLKLEQIKSYKMNAFSFVSSAKVDFDLIFADPPYDLEGIDTLPDTIFKNKMVREGGLLILEHSKGKDFSAHPNFMEIRSYGSVNFSLFEPR